MRRIKRKSLQEKLIADKAKQYHRERLDNLLNSNELKRVNVAPHGDCFFEAVLLNSGEENLYHNIDEFRQVVCWHLLQHWKRHTQMEVDSVHSNIERAKKKQRYLFQVSGTLSSPFLEKTILILLFL
ncbi:unnamed protein product [Owenia fusiformis]|uniref:OTU domain-containing protein n=1 Tax=Owenia fusiformis TaxID=6347 RepID=A0A8S4Q9M2_OWEFU|nr:unnamed protein product [Owenia fusiformis]